MMRKIKGKTGQNNFGTLISKYFLLIALLLLIAVFSIAQPRFFSVSNLLDIVSSASLVGIMALGACIVMSVGEMNFALGAEATLVAGLLGYTLQEQIIPWYLVAMLAALLVALLIGLFNSAFAVRLGVPAFVATLAISKIHDGVYALISNNKTMFSKNWPTQFKLLGQGYIGPIPILVIVFLAVGIACWLLMDKTKLGRHICAVGQNAVACKQVGISVKGIKTIAFLLCSLLAGLAGILASSRNFNVMTTLGSGMMMNAMSAAMLGATFLRPGRFNVQGTIVAALMVSVISNGLLMLQSPDYLKDIVQGVIMIIAVGYIALTRKEGLPSVKMG